MGQGTRVVPQRAESMGHGIEGVAQHAESMGQGAEGVGHRTESVGQRTEVVPPTNRERGPTNRWNGPGHRLQIAHLSHGFSSDPANGSSDCFDGPNEISEEERRDEALRRELIRLLDEHHWNISEVARAMGKAWMQIHRWMKKFDLNEKRRS